VATNILAALTGSASGGMTIALDALGDTYMRVAAEHGINPTLMHRVAAIGSGTLDSLPHNGAVVTLLAVCGSTHRESYFDIVMVGIVSALIALVAVIALGSMLPPSKTMGAAGAKQMYPRDIPVAPWQSSAASSRLESFDHASESLQIRENCGGTAQRGPADVPCRPHL
jgi:Mg2+/citrate symporter